MGKRRSTGRLRKRSTTRSGRPLVFPAQRRAAAERAGRGPVAATTKAVAKQVRRLPRPVVWLVWLGGAALDSVLIGFALGLARPREAEPRETP